MPKRLIYAILVASMALTAPGLISSTAIAHGDHGGGHHGGHEGGFGGDDHSHDYSPGRGEGFDGDHTGYEGDDFHRTHRITRRFHNGDGFLDNFDDEDECYPEWFYNRGDLPFRSGVCPD
ncbi:hypothetical protein FZ934_25725 (plasmid) [Rhizobium grahamii]|uniref:Uncharacterized protein n=1 Tax=Rhizobium grahamii TaxID=1120045 RepID=A0A5Q0CCW1_9HYPH|nr:MULTISPECIES: hypothetical protein [Rhizobium]QFY63636.1 hypothetical protein FZ934_25725 [Rhizobium grahamii]QRM51598.1 hypothetical protein F3Y33_19920 [Rhizobium sp. BG6]